ncbi:MAG: hypothetical protein AB9866_21445 [Syntrophobacteraceae bacterium]
MKNPWFRLYAEFAADPKVQNMPEKFQRRLIMLFCLRCANDLCELEEEEIRCALRISPKEFAQTKNLFVQKGFISSNFSVTNWNARQFISDDVSERVQRHREKVKRYSNVSETLQNVSCNKSCNAPITEQNRTEQSRAEYIVPPEIPEKKTTLKENTEEAITRLLDRYNPTEQKDIQQVFELLKLTRKNGKISDTILLTELRRWNTLSVERVMYAVMKYIDRGYHTEGKKEGYLFSIMKNVSEAELTRATRTASMPSSASQNVSRLTEHNLQIFELLNQERANAKRMG